MKRFFIAAALMTVCAVAIAVCVVPDAIPSILHDPAALLIGGKALLATPALVALRTRHAELTTQATAKLAEVREGMPADQVRAIEQAHAELVRQATEAQAQITAEEARATPPAPPAPVVVPAPTADQMRQAGELAAAAERQRFADIRAACDAVGLNDQAADMFTRGLSIDQARAELLNKLAVRSRENPTRPQIVVTRDEGDTLRQAVESAIILRANPTAIAANAPEREMARNWRGMSLLEMGRTFLEQTQGRQIRGLSKRELATVLMGLDGLGSRMQMSTSDFANLLANVASKRLRDAYTLAPQNWKRIGRQSNNPDFKQKSVVQLSSAPAFKKVVEGGEFSYGAFTDGVEKYALATYGRIVAITRQTLINDDLGAFDRIPTMLGRQAAELEASTFWSVLTSNPTMGDSLALFHATHGNLAGSGGAINDTTLTAAKAAMRKQKALADKSADAEPLNLIPAFLIVSPDKEVEAAKMLTAVLATQASNVNVFSNSMSLIVEARLTGNTWYLSADPATIDTVEYAYLEGDEGVFIEQRIGFEVDGIEIKGRLDFAAKAIDWRGLYKNPGA